MIYAAITLGAAIPALIYVMARASVMLWLATETVISNTRFEAVYLLRNRARTSHSRVASLKASDLYDRARAVLASLCQ